MVSALQRPRGTVRLAGRWPEIPYPEWQETCAALHLYAQIIGKYRLGRTPWHCHSWHATLYPTPLGLTTGPVWDEGGAIEVTMDLVDHRILGAASNGSRSSFPLQPMSVAEFDASFRELVLELGGTPVWDGSPNEVPAPIPFADDRMRRPYDADAVHRFSNAMVSISGVFQHFRTAFLGKVSPVHLFWGGFDLAVTRFSGRRAPVHPGGIPFLPDNVTREAYSHEVSSAGFWPGSGLGYPAFYSYAYPALPKFMQAVVQPPAAFFHSSLGEFILPYEVVRRSDDPAQMLLGFLETTYRAAAQLAAWDSAELECGLGEPRRPRRIPGA